MHNKQVLELTITRIANVDTNDKKKAVLDIILEDLRALQKRNILMELLQGNLTCQDCGDISSDVQDTICPFDEEINGSITHITVCDSCEYARARSI